MARFQWDHEAGAAGLHDGLETFSHAVHVRCPNLLQKPHRGAVQLWLSRMQSNTQKSSQQHSQLADLLSSVFCLLSAVPLSCPWESVSSRDSHSTGDADT